MVEPLVPGKRMTYDMMSVSDVADAAEFWRVWKFFGGKTGGWVDEDGDEVDLEQSP